MRNHLPTIYLAAPLFNDVELERNRSIKSALVAHGFLVFLPQEDVGRSVELFQRHRSQAKVIRAIFTKDVHALRSCCAVLCVLDGRVPDEGMCVELGIAFALGKPCYGLKTDIRQFNEQGDSIMIQGCLRRTSSSLEQLIEMMARDLRPNGGATTARRPKQK